MMPKIDLNSYNTEGFFDEMFAEDKNVRAHYELFKDRLKKMGWKKLNFLQHSTDRAQLSMGMTFNVYSDNQGIERILPLDIIPRIISAKDWDFIERGLKQRIIALNLFLDDCYNILCMGIILGKNQRLRHFLPIWKNFSLQLVPKGLNNFPYLINSHDITV